MTISIDVEGDMELIAKLERIGKQASPAMVDIANKTAIELQGSIKDRLRKKGTGRVYKRGNATHRASAGWMPPAVDTGRLLNSVYFDSARGFLGAAVATVGSKVVYAQHLEYGTLRMLPRPVWRPEAFKAQVKFLKRVNAYLDRVTQ